MNIFEVAKLINANADYEMVLNHYNFENIKIRRDNIKCCCKIHDGDNPTAFNVSLDKNLWYCFTGPCGGGDIIDLVEKIEGISFQQAVEKLVKLLNLDIQNIEYDYKNNDITVEQRKWLRKNIKQDATIPKYELPSVPYTTTYEGFDRFSEATIKYYNSGFAKVYPMPNSVCKNKLVVPIDKDKETKLVALRALDDSKLKWFYHPEVKISSILYNYDKVLELVEKGETKVIIVEGIFDVWAYHEIGLDNCVAIFGSSLKEEQAEMLLKLGVDFIFSFDGDKAGQKCTEETYNKLCKYSHIDKIKFLSEEDPASISREELLKRYLERTRL